ncbi:MAG: PorT family protein, partial [Bacteroidota bacterium]
MRFFFLGLFLFSTAIVFSQETKLPFPMIAVDSLYREDQFYFSISHSILQNSPSGVSTNKFSPTFKVGFLRDFPINKRRNKAIAPGLGLSFTNYFQNLFILSENGNPVYSTNSVADSYDTNKFEQLFIDVPLEFRWRTSVAGSHRLWWVCCG